MDQLHDQDNVILSELYRKISRISNVLSFISEQPSAIYKYASDKDTIFADPINKLYPCNTKEATILSYVYFLEFRDDGDNDSDTIRQTFYKFASYHKCLDSLKILDEIYEERGYEGFIDKSAWGKDCKDPRFRNFYNKKKKSNTKVKKKAAAKESKMNQDVEDKYIKPEAAILYDEYSKKELDEVLFPETNELYHYYRESKPNEELLTILKENLNEANKNRKKLSYYSIYFRLNPIYRVLKERGATIPSELYDKLRRFAGEGKPNPEKLKEYLDSFTKLIDQNIKNISKRMSQEYVKNISSLREDLIKMKNDIEKIMQDKSRTERVFWTVVLDEIRTQLESFFPMNVEMPENVMFEYSDEQIKEAEDRMVIDKYRGIVYDENDLLKIKPYDFRCHFGEKFYNDIADAPNKISIKKLASKLREGDKNLCDKFYNFINLYFSSQTHPD